MFRPGKALMNFMRMPRQCRRRAWALASLYREGARCWLDTTLIYVDNEVLFLHNRGIIELSFPKVGMKSSYSFREPYATLFWCK